MRINNIFLQNNSQFIVKKTNNFKQGNPQNPTYCTPTFAHYVSFMGGNSLDLKQSVINLESIETQGKTKFPPDIKEAAHKVIKSANPDNKTLVDIHKEKYALLEDCYDLVDVKRLFDEFNGVLSDTDVDYRQDSFIAKVKNGEVENLNKDEDLAFQLLKLYWAQGFSLNDLKEYFGVNLYHTLAKFNIPLMDKDYAHVLKFSDRGYNERLTSQMAQKRIEASDRRAQLTQGEPVYIPPGPLSEMHKKHISEGLIRHYSQHPEKLVLMSQRQKEYFENNPEQRELMQQIMFYAWNNTQEGRSVRKHLIKFFKKAGVAIDDNVYTSNQAKMTASQNNTLKNFWDKNKWAKEKFSVAVKTAWHEVKKVNEIKKSTKQYVIYLAPEKQNSKMADWAVLNLKDLTGYTTTANFSSLPDSEMLKLSETLNNTYYAAHPEDKDFLVVTLEAALLSVKNDIIKNKISFGVCNNKDFLLALQNNILSIFNFNNFVVHLDDDSVVPKIISFKDAEHIVSYISKLCAIYKQDKFAEYLRNKISNAYCLLEDIDSVDTAAKFMLFIGYEPN